jgi:hypothetical protein
MSTMGWFGHSKIGGGYELLLSFLKGYSATPLEGGRQGI